VAASIRKWENPLYTFNEKLSFPIQSMYDKSHFLQRDYLSLYMDNDGSIKTETPIFLPNSTVVQTGKRAVVSPFKNDDFFTDALSITKIIGDGKSLSLGAAGNLSELFPLVSASSMIEETATQHKWMFVDGGYFENLGLNTAMDFGNSVAAALETLKTKNSALKALVEKVEIHYLSVLNSPIGFSEIDSEMQIMAPVKAIINTPFGGHSDKAYQVAKDRFGQKFHCIVLNKDVPLTRLLTVQNMDEMDNELYKNPTLQELIQLLK
jgi:hypothetical protein